MTKPTHDCCSSSQAQPNKRSCPGHGGACGEVSYTTLSHHIKQPWRLTEKTRRFFFCDDPDCDIIYFDDENWQVQQSDVRTNIGAKDTSGEAMVCYCYGVTRTDALKDADIKKFVMDRTKQKLCSCQTQNPSGQCCLKNFPRNKDP